MDDGEDQTDTEEHPADVEGQGSQTTESERERDETDEKEGDC